MEEWYKYFTFSNDRNHLNYIQEKYGNQITQNNEKSTQTELYAKDVVSSQSLTISQENKASPDRISPLSIRQQNISVQPSQTTPTTSNEQKKKPRITIISRGNQETQQQVAQQPPQSQVTQTEQTQNTKYYLEFSEDS